MKRSSSIFSSFNTIYKSRLYHSFAHPASNQIIKPANIETKILNQAITHIQKYGFEEACINEAIRELNYPGSLESVLSFSGAGKPLGFQLALHWLKVQREALAKEASNTESKLSKIKNEYERAAYLIKKRLELNRPVMNNLDSVLSRMILPYNITESLEELQNLADDIAFYAGDNSNDFAWYSKRFSIGYVYLSSELFMLQDKSVDYSHTNEFVDSKMQEIKNLGSAYSSAEEWTFFNMVSIVNLISSQLRRG